MKIHVIDLETNKTYCGGGVFGDKAITLEAARDMNNGLYFDCEDCYAILAPEDHNGTKTEG